MVSKLLSSMDFGLLQQSDKSSTHSTITTISIDVLLGRMNHKLSFNKNDRPEN